MSQHSLVEQHVPHGLGDDHVHLLRQLNLLNLAIKKLDHVINFVGSDQHAGVDSYAARLYSVHLGEISI